ncbi:MAG: hypothetical protein EZS28_051055 [Streblomastix strix]|uniref:Uncharacterized protein n=1 Tax=Streblomastix strix TaxID=222440 RepID=A0A5J4T4V0_9EUKA|nr:MAG: hypothetical protein EZS28_051055 [Streblomastix strix]
MRITAKEELKSQVLTYQGEVVEYAELPGEYVLTLEDLFGNILTSSFYYLPAIAREYDLEVEYITLIKLNGVNVENPTYLHLIEDGAYLLRYENTLGKEVEVVLTVDNVEPWITFRLVEGQMIIYDEPSEPLRRVSLYLDDKLIEVPYGQALTEFGHYYLEIEDMAGNISWKQWDQKYQLNLFSWIVILLGAGVVVGGIIGIIRVKKFKQKQTPIYVENVH